MDLNPGAFRRGRAHQVRLRPDGSVHFYKPDAAALPFGEGSFDVAWCAHSLVSLPDPQAAIREMRRMVRPGGHVAVVENDILHDVILPWPADLELALGRAQREAYRGTDRSPRRLHIVRRLGEICHRAGLEVVRRTTYPVDRCAPLGGNDQRFVTLYLQRAWERARDHLPPAQRHRLWRLVDPDSLDFLLRRRDFAMTCLDVVILARVPIENAPRS